MGDEPGEVVRLILVTGIEGIWNQVISPLFQDLVMLGPKQNSEAPAITRSHKIDRFLRETPGTVREPRPNCQRAWIFFMGGNNVRERSREPCRILSIQASEKRSGEEKRKFTEDNKGHKERILRQKITKATKV